jgi:hypothetical protein
MQGADEPVLPRISLLGVAPPRIVLLEFFYLPIPDIFGELLLRHLHLFDIPRSL